MTFELSRNNSNVQEFSVLIRYVYGENTKFYVLMVSNKRKDISLLEWNSDIHPSKEVA